MHIKNTNDNDTNNNDTNNNDTNNNDTNNDDTNNTIKKIVIIDSILQNKHIKKINCIKEKKMRVETKTWGLNETELSHQTQLNMLSNKLDKVEKDKYMSLLISHIKSKICSYKQQDIVKKKLDEKQLVTFEEVVELLKKCGLTCHYCSDHVFILYEKVREMKQWSLDRINNDIGHNNGNLVIACLECNLKRRRTNKDAFMFTKNMVIVRESI
jgi:HrpA-like RNA helicase